MMEFEEFEPLISCPICIEEYVDPRLLPCQHTFCEKCLLSYINRKSKVNKAAIKEFPCPICRHMTKLPENSNDEDSAFPKCLTINMLLETKAALLQESVMEVDTKSSCETQTLQTSDEQQVRCDEGFIAACDVKDTSDVKHDRKSFPAEKHQLQVSKKKRSWKSLTRKPTKGKKTKPERQHKLKDNHENKMEHTDDDLEVAWEEMLLINYVFIPLFSRLWTPKTFFAIIVVFVSLAVITFSFYYTPFCVLFFQLLIAFTTRNCQKYMIRHNICKNKNVVVVTIMFSTVLMSILILALMTMFNIFAVVKAMKSTILDAVSRNDSTLTMEAFRVYHSASLLSWLNSVEQMNVLIQIYLHRLIGYILW